MDSSTIDVSETHLKPRDIPENRRKNLTIEIAGAAIFSALSIALSALIIANPLLVPRVPGWYIAYFDPISII